MITLQNHPLRICRGFSTGRYIITENSLEEHALPSASYHPQHPNCICYISPQSVPILLTQHIQFLGEAGIKRVEERILERM
jgi:hypothetical protein